MTKRDNTMMKTEFAMKKTRRRKRDCMMMKKQKTKSETSDILKHVITKKAVGEDLLSHIVLKNTRVIFSKLLNKSLHDCSFTKCWKSAIVMSLLRKEVSPQIIVRYHWLVVPVKKWKE